MSIQEERIPREPPTLLDDTSDSLRQGGSDGRHHGVDGGAVAAARHETVLPRLTELEAGERAAHAHRTDHQAQLAALAAVLRGHAEGERAAKGAIGSGDK